MAGKAWSVVDARAKNSPLEQWHYDDYRGACDFAARGRRGDKHNQHLGVLLCCLLTVLLALPADLCAPAEVGAATGLCQAGSGAGAIAVQ